MNSDGEVEKLNKPLPPRAALVMMCHCSNRNPNLGQSLKVVIQKAGAVPYQRECIFFPRSTLHLFGKHLHSTCALDIIW